VYIHVLLSIPTDVCKHRHSWVLSYLLLIALKHNVIKKVFSSLTEVTCFLHHLCENALVFSPSQLLWTCFWSVVSKQHTPCIILM